MLMQTLLQRETRYKREIKSFYFNEHIFIF